MPKSVDACSQGKHPDIMMLIIGSPDGNKLQGTTWLFHFGTLVTSLSEITFEHPPPLPPQIQQGACCRNGPFHNCFFTAQLI